MSSISLICALGTNRAIGRDNQLLWQLPGDLKRFKQLTIGKPVIMGRKTFESIGRPLPERTNFVLTSNRDWRVEGAVSCFALGDALGQTHAPEIMVIGGGQVYAEALPQATTLYLTEVDDAPDADAFFPEWDRAQFTLIDEQPGAPLPGTPKFRYRTYKRSHDRFLI